MSERREVTTLKNVDGASTATSAGTTTAHLTHATVAEPSGGVLDGRGWAYASLGVAVLTVGVGRARGMPDGSRVHGSSVPIA
jgi:hypothetical protein